MSAQQLPGADRGTPSFEDLRDRIQADFFAGMPAHIDRLTWSADRLRDCQRERLRAALAAAKRGSPFHARRLAGVDPSRFELTDLRDLPVMTKAEMMAEFDDVITDRRLTREAAERALAAAGGMTPQVLPGGYLCIATGGSSGQRGIFAHDAASAAEWLSLIFRTGFAATAAARSAAETDSQPVPSLHVAMVAAPSAVHGTVAGPSILEGSRIRFSHVPVTGQLPAMVGRLNQLQPQALIGYPSMLARLAAEQGAGRLRIAPEMVTSTAETLLPEFRAAIKAFGAPITDSFVTSEGLVGVSAPDDPVITLTTDSCIVELVDEDWRPVAPGTPSASVLVTNLYNRVQPLIRYELTDSFTQQPDGAEHGHLRATVAGRSDDILHYAAADVHPMVLRSVLLTRREVIDYQVRQIATGVDVWVLLERHLDLSRLRDDLRAALQRAGLSDPEVHVEAVSSLPRHPETGKLRRVIPA